MMQDPALILTISAFALIGTTVVSLIALRGWRDWITLKSRELDNVRDNSAVPSASSRIEVADLKERIKKLEAIAAGVEL